MFGKDKDVRKHFALYLPEQHCDEETFQILERLSNKVPLVSKVELEGISTRFPSAKRISLPPQAHCEVFLRCHDSYVYVWI